MANELGKLLKQKRLELDMTQKDVADKVGVTLATINKYETGIVSDIPRKRIIALADALDLDPMDLILPQNAQKAGKAFDAFIESTKDTLTDDLPQANYEAINNYLGKYAASIQPHYKTSNANAQSTGRFKNLGGVSYELKKHPTVRGTVLNPAEVEAKRTQRLSKQEELLVKVYRELSVEKQIQLMQHVLELEKEMKS